MPLERWSENVVVVHLADDPQLTDDLVSLEHFAAHHPADAVLDFATVQFINSSNIAKLLKIRKKFLTEHGRLILCNVGTQVHGALIVTGLEKMFTVSENVPTALATLQMERGAGAPPPGNN